MIKNAYLHHHKEPMTNFHQHSSPTDIPVLHCMDLPLSIYRCNKYPDSISWLVNA